MYRCRITYDEWKCMKKKRRVGKVIRQADFTGYIGILDILEVSEPQIWKYNGKEVTVCNNNYQWLSIMPENEYYCMTVMMNEKQEIQVCYVDLAINTSNKLKTGLLNDPAALKEYIDKMCKLAKQ